MQQILQHRQQRGEATVTIEERECRKDDIGKKFTYNFEAATWDEMISFKVLYSIKYAFE